MPFQRFKNAVMQGSRTKKLDHFYTLCSRHDQVLDVGVSDNEHNAQVNLFLNSFRFAPEQYTGLAVQPMDGMRRKHPDKEFVEYPGGEFPFATGQFDWVFSNAVIEHVGTRQDQVFFVEEMMRVAKRVFFTTPNKYFPIESHTNTFLRHWSDRAFYPWCARNKPYWSRDNLLLLSHTALNSILQEAGGEYEILKNRMLGWPMTFTVVCARAETQQSAA